MKTHKFLLLLILAVLWLTGCGAPAGTDVVDLAKSEARDLSAPVDEYAPLRLTVGDVLTLESLQKIDPYPLYTLHYYADYETAALPPNTPLTNDSLVDLSITSQKLASSPWACSLFTALADPESMVYGRNFDWEYSPALLLFTDPPDGYASVSMVDIAFLGFHADQMLTLDKLDLNYLVTLLDAPYLPFDGMNEMGLVIGMAAVPPGDMETDPSKETVGSVFIIREMLDHAASVAEALDIFSQYNIDFSGGPPIHYLLADVSGAAALIEFYQGEIHIIGNDQPWHQATNFLRSAYADSGPGRCWRFDTISHTLAETQGNLTPQAAMDTLAAVAQDGTQWSVVYGMSTGEVQVVVGQDYDTVHQFQLEFPEK